MAAIPTTFVLDAILPSEDLQAMGRKRYQRPSVLRTRAKAEQLGHATEQMSEHYVRESFADHAAAVGRIAKMIERVM